MVAEWVREMKETAEWTSSVGTWYVGALFSRKESSKEAILQPKAVLYA